MPISVLHRKGMTFDWYLGGPMHRGAGVECFTFDMPRDDPSLPMMKAIGVAELAAHLKGEIPLEEATARAKTQTRNYIKRQLT